MISLFVVFLGWILIGIVVGSIACPRYPGPHSMGWMGIVLVGVTGSLLGGGATYLLGYGVSPSQVAGWIMSIVGAIAFVSVPTFKGRMRARA
jgi:uncharacterized membrane protein YeaQ/YmgE (transglycosylase-associated protein family)